MSYEFAVKTACRSQLVDEQRFKYICLHRCFLTVIFFLFACIGLAFSLGGKYLALAERRDCKDYISVFACATWQLIKVLATYATAVYICL